MRYLVVGGTHIGIRSCYGEKEFIASNDTALVEAVKKDIKLIGRIEQVYVAGHLGWQSYLPDGSVEFEWYVAKIML